MTVFGLLPVVREIYIRENIDLVHGHAVSQIKISLHWNVRRHTRFAMSYEFYRFMKSLNLVSRLRTIPKHIWRSSHQN